VPERIVVLHVVIKRQFFYIYICSFSTNFILQMHIIAQAYLRCCKDERKPYWNTCGFNLVIVVINTSFTYWRIASELTRKVKEQILTSGGVIAERVHTVEARHKHHAAFASDFRIRHTVQLQNCHLCWRRLLVAPQDVTFFLHLQVPQQQYLSELPSTLRSLNVWLPCP